jgi:hypothetical protein
MRMHRAEGAMSSQFLEDFDGYSDDQIDKIIQAGGGLTKGRTSVALKTKLHHAILNIQWTSEWRKDCLPINPSDYVVIARAATKILKLLEAKSDDNSYNDSSLAWGLKICGSQWAEYWYRTYAKGGRRRDHHKKVLTGKQSTPTALQRRRDVRDAKLKR